ncbi:unnamed protein product, partial [Phaeothamnion confervicola]
MDCPSDVGSAVSATDVESLTMEACSLRSVSARSGCAVSIVQPAAAAAAVAASPGRAGTAVLRSCRFVNCTAKADGGALRVGQGSSDNAGAVYIDKDAPADFSASTFSRNLAALDCGVALLTNGATVTVDGANRFVSSAANAGRVFSVSLGVGADATALAIRSTNLFFDNAVKTYG